MSNWAAPGVQCVCVKDDFGWFMVDGCCIPHRVPMLNEVLTVQSVKASGENVTLTFHEIPADQSDGHLHGYDISFAARCFRPLIKRKSDISIFRAMLNPKKIEVTA